MAAAAAVGRTLEQTPTWAVAVVCFVLVVVSFLIEHIIHLIGQWLKKKHKRALCEALEKFKSELMLLGFISLLLTVGQGPITSICISEEAAATWHPCDRKQQSAPDKTAGSGTEITNRRRLLSLQDSGVGFRRVLAAASTGDKCAAKGMVPFVSVEGIHQLHIFIFLLAVFHVLNCLLTIVFGRAKMRRWKTWENETKTAEYQFSNDSKRFRFTRETSFGRRHLSFWTKTPVLMWIVCFFRQFVRSVPKVDYLTLRHGFIMAHLAPQSQAQYNFQKYIKRSLEEDFKVVVGISPPIWFFAVLFLLFNTHGWYSYRWLPFIPLIIIFLVGAKLQAIITKMALRINDRGEVVKGAPVVQPGDHLFWFNRPCILLFLINFVLFQNAFQLAFVAWSWYEFGLKSCFHDSTEEVVIRISMGIVVQILCSYVTLPLYALVTQMGSTMKPTIFNERIAKALRDWHQSAKKHIKQRGEGSVNSTSSRPSIPSHRTMSPLQLLQHYKSDVDSRSTSPRKSSSFDLEQQCWEIESQSPSTRPRQDDEGSVSSQHHHGNEAEEDVSQEPSFRIMAALAESGCTQHTIDIGAKEFAFGESSDRI